MIVNAVSLKDNLSYGSSKKNARRIAAGLLALATLQGAKTAPAYASSNWQSAVEKYYPYSTQKSDLDKVYSKYGDIFDIKTAYNDDFGLYYIYQGRTFDLNGVEITNPNIKNIKKADYTASTDYDRLYEIYGRIDDLQVCSDKYYGRYYTYAGFPLDTNGNLIFDKLQDSKFSWMSGYSLTDFQKIFGIYGENLEMKEHKDKYYGVYYTYAGRYYNTKGQEIKYNSTPHYYYNTPTPTQKPTFKPTPTPRQYSEYELMTDLQRMYEIYGNAYSIEEYYDSNIGTYYSYAGKYYDAAGNEIKKPSKTASSSKNTTKTIDSRIKENSDFYGYYQIYGDKYKIKSHWDPNVGAYYQYGPYAFDENGNNIPNAKDLYKFDSTIK